LTLTPRVSGVNSSYTSDLPYLPSLSATIQTPGIGATIQSFDTVLYDPLLGKLEFTFNGYSISECPIGIKDFRGEVTSPTFICQVTMGAKTVDTLTAVAGTGSVPLRPPRYFKGYFILRQSALLCRCKLRVPRKRLKKPYRSYFPKFPRIRFENYGVRSKGGFSHNEIDLRNGFFGCDLFKG